MEALQPSAEGQPAKRPPPPDFSKKSFAQMFTMESQTLTDFPLSVHKGEIAIKLSTAAIEKLSVPFKFALVGKFSHGRPSIEETRKSFSKLDLKAALDVGLIDYRHVLMRFHSEADFHRIWTRGIWQIGKYPMRVFKWSPSFQTSKETSTVPVWFELPGLPCHLFEKSVLFSIMKAVGVPISVDAATLILARPSVARVNVEIDLLKELPSRIWIEHGDDGDGFWQKLVPENLPAYCISCFRQGHSQEGCSMNEIRVQRTWKTKETAVTEVSPSSAGQQQAAMIVVNTAQEDHVASTGKHTKLTVEPSKAAESSSKQNADEKMGPAVPVTEASSSSAGQQQESAMFVVNLAQEESGVATGQDINQTGCTMYENREKENWKPKAVTSKPPTSAAVAASKPLLLEIDPGETTEAVYGVESSVSPAAVTLKPPTSTAVAASKPLLLEIDGAGVMTVTEAVHGVESSGKQNVRGAALSGKQDVSTNLEGILSLPLSGQQMGSIELDRALSLVSNSLEDQTITQVSAQKIIDWDYVFQTISGNILHNKSDVNENLASKIHFTQVSRIDHLTNNFINEFDDTILLDGVLNSETKFESSNHVIECSQGTNGNGGTNVNDEQIMEVECPSPTFDCPHVTNITEGKQIVVGVCATNNCREKGAVLQPILGVEDRNAELQLAWKNLLLSSKNSPGTNATKEFIDSVPRNEELEPRRSIQRGDRYDGLNNAWQNLISSNAYGEVVELEQMGEAFHSGVAPPEDDKKRKHGMSDRVLRSMLSAYNSDPSRASSL